MTVPIDERMAIALAREIRDGDFMSHGSSVPLAAAALMFAKATHAPDLDFCYQGTISTRERDPAKLLTDMTAIYAGATAFFSLGELIDLELRGRSDLQFLRPLQIDRHGNVNASLIGTPEAPKLRVHGMAMGDSGCTVRRTVLYVTEHSARVFPERLDAVTGLGHADGGRWRERLRLPGAGPSRVISPLGVMDFDTPDRFLRLREVFEGVEVAEVVSATGFELAVADRVGVVPISQDDVATLRAIDPIATRHMEFRELRAAARERVEAARTLAPPA